MFPPVTTRCLLLLIDGLRPDLAEAELAAGSLPNLAALVAHGGVGRAITSFPSTTSVAYLPFLTGCTPGRCNVPSIRWLDRTRYGGRWWRDRHALRSYCGYQASMLDGDIVPDVRTMFDLVPESVGIFTPIARGLGNDRDPTRRARKFWGALGHFSRWHQPSDDVAGGHLLDAVTGGARFIFAQFPAVDGYTHQQGPYGDGVRRALRKIDTLIGAVRRRLSARGELDDTLILLVSDHGSAAVDSHLDLAEWFRARGIRTLAHPLLWTRDPEVAVMVAGNGSAMVYAQPQVPRERRWPLARLRERTDRDLVAALVAEEAVAFVAAEEADGAVRVLSREGEAEIRRLGNSDGNGGRDGGITYRPLSGDPLEVGGARTACDRAWLEATWDASYPDAAYQLLDQFRSSRTGDLLVIARAGYDFRDRFEVPEHRAGHGSLTRDHMQTPLWASHPLPAGPFRTVDLFPAMLHWLGVDAPADIDGDGRWLPARQ